MLVFNYKKSKTRITKVSITEAYQIKDEYFYQTDSTYSHKFIIKAENSENNRLSINHKQRPLHIDFEFSEMLSEMEIDKNIIIELWRKNEFEGGAEKMIIVNDKIIVITDAFYILDINDGSLIKSFESGKTGTHQNKVHHDNIIYYTTRSGRLDGIDIEQMKIIWKENSPNYTTNEEAHFAR